VMKVETVTPGDHLGAVSYTHLAPLTLPVA